MKPLVADRDHVQNKTKNLGELLATSGALGILCWSMAVFQASVSNAAYWPLRRHHPAVPMGTRVYRGCKTPRESASVPGGGVCLSMHCRCHLEPQNGSTCTDTGLTKIYARICRLSLPHKWASRDHCWRYLITCLCITIPNTAEERRDWTPPKVLI